MAEKLCELKKKGGGRNYKLNKRNHRGIIGGSL